MHLSILVKRLWGVCVFEKHKTKTRKYQTPEYVHLRPSPIRVHDQCLWFRLMPELHSVFTDHNVVCLWFKRAVNDDWSSDAACSCFVLYRGLLIPHHQKITTPVFRVVLQNCSIPGYFPYIIFYRCSLSLLSSGWFVIVVCGPVSVRELVK